MKKWSRTELELALDVKWYLNGGYVGVRVGEQGRIAKWVKRYKNSNYQINKSPG